MAICVYGAYALATALFETALSGAMIYLLAQPDLCERLAAIASLSHAGLGFCRRHSLLVRVGMFGGIVGQLGLDVLVLSQLWKMFVWAEHREGHLRLSEDEEKMLQV